MVHRCLTLSRLAAATLLIALLAPGASAQQFQVQSTFHDGFRYSIQDVRLDRQGAIIERSSGGRVKGTLKLDHHCPDCGNTINQVIIGLAGAEIAQKCVYSGGASSRGTKKLPFSVDVPDEPGVYEIRARYAQARNCGKALGWWQVDMPGGPDASATIGAIVVLAQAEPIRDIGDIYSDIVSKTRQLDGHITQIRRLSDGTKKVQKAQLQNLRRQAAAAEQRAFELHLLQTELAIATGAVISAEEPQPVYDVVLMPARPSRRKS